MNLLTKLALITAFSTFAFSEVTMCFKQNHTNMATIEDTKLDGGICAGAKSPKDMKKEGWKIDDIKISSNSFFYVFKKVELNLDNVDMDALESKILAKMQQKKEKEEVLAIKKAKTEKIAEGKKTYTKKCMGCHGINAELLPSNSIALNSIKLDRFLFAIEGYKRGTYDLGDGASMKQFAQGINSITAKNVYIYLQSLKPENKETKTKDTVSK